MISCITTAQDSKRESGQFAIANTKYGFEHNIPCYNMVNEHFSLPNICTIFFKCFITLPLALAQGFYLSAPPLLFSIFV